MKIEEYEAEIIARYEQYKEAFHYSHGDRLTYPQFVEGLVKEKSDRRKCWTQIRAMWQDEYPQEKS